MALTAHYTYGFGLISQVSATGVASYYDFNNIGSVVGITGAGGTYENSYTYSPFGQVSATMAAVENPFTYVGQFGVVTIGQGLMNMEARVYGPALGQFLSPDPLGVAGGDANVRRYVNANPVNLIDPIGLSCGPISPKDPSSSAQVASVLRRTSSSADYLKLWDLP